MKRFLACLGLSLSMVSAVSAVTNERACSAEVPNVTVGPGTVCGVVHKNPQGQSSHAYLGIPFAQPPIGPLRWQSPQPFTLPSGEVFAASEFGAECVQPSGSLDGYSGSEDCLTINIYRPTDSTLKDLPVLLYIHGGGFLLTQPERELNGTAWTHENVVVVTFNYRLGPFGFMRYTGKEAGLAGNYGVQDQTLAMEWVRDHIAGFGGDPAKVTLFGESVGAMSVGLHLFSSPASESLFRAAIMESNIMGIPYPNIREAERTGKAFIDVLCKSYAPASCPADTPWLQSLSTQQIAQAELLTLPPGGMPGLVTAALTGELKWAPIMGISPLIDHQPIKGFGPGITPKPYAFGVNKNEGAFFLNAPSSLTPSQYRKTVIKAFGTSAASRILAYSEEGHKLYNPKNYQPLPGGGLTPASQALAQLQTDYAVAAANQKAASRTIKQLAAQGLSLYGYHFVYEASFNFNGLLRCSVASMNICHTNEIPFVWWDLVQKDQFGFTVDVENPTETDIAVAKSMNSAWANFAKDPMTGFGYPPLYDDAANGYVIWDAQESVGTLIPRKRYALWKPLLP